MEFLVIVKVKCIGFGVCALHPGEFLSHFYTISCSSFKAYFFKDNTETWRKFLIVWLRSLLSSLAARIN